jgi:hypothetical protein
LTAAKQISGVLLASGIMWSTHPSCWTNINHCSGLHDSNILVGGMFRANKSVLSKKRLSN